MRHAIHLPQLGFGQDSATLFAWQRAIGETVQRGDVIAEVEVEKTNIDVEVHTPGTIAQLLYSPGDRIAVGQIIAYLDVTAETA